HPLRHFGHAGGEQLAIALHLDQAEPAGADGREAVELAECWNGHAVLAGGRQDRLILARPDRFAVDRERPHAGRATDHVSLTLVGASVDGAPVDTIASRYSWRKKRSVLSTGFGAACPRPQRLVCFTTSHRSSSSARSAGDASLRVKRPSRSYISAVPTRQGTHLPH